MRKVIKCLVSSATIMAIMATSTIESFAYNYDGSATAYAYTYAENYNKKYTYFDKGDCTNFVSQAVNAGGISIADSKPGGVAENNLNAWYIKYVDGTWRYSRSWTVVEDFKEYMKKRKCATVKTFSQKNWACIYEIVENGDVLQVDGEHSVMITEIGERTGNTIKYCGHTNDVQNGKINIIKNQAKENWASKDIVIIHFK